MRKKSEPRTQNPEPRLKISKEFSLYCIVCNLCSVLCVLLSVFCVLFLLSCTKTDRMYKKSRLVMDTVCTITVVSPSKKQAGEAIEAGFASIERIEHILDFFSGESELSAINRAAGKGPVRISRETLDVIQRSAEVAEYTRGAFDPTIGPLMELWGFSGPSSGSASIPDAEAIRTMTGLVDFKKMSINVAASEVSLSRKGMKLDLGGIAKGYAADMAIDAIKAKGIKSALVAVAGDIKGFGLRPDLKPWKVGIQNPRVKSIEVPDGDGDTIIATIDLKAEAVSTSGDYQRFFVTDGERYHHILDPETGFPARGVISVTVIAPDGYMADGLSTGIFILGREKGIKLLESLGFDGIIVDSDKQIYVTENLEGRIDIEGFH